MYLVVTTLLMLAAPPNESMLTCSKLVNDAERLNCYDRSVAALQEKLGTNTTTYKNNATSTKLINDTVGITALDRKFIEVDRVTYSKVTKKATISLSNSSIYRQTDSTRTRASEFKDGIHLMAGALGSTKMQLSSGKQIKVKEIKD